MKYIELSPKEMIAFADKLKKECGLIIKMLPAKVTLDESQYGKGWVAWKESYSFRVIEKNNDGILPGKASTDADEFLKLLNNIK